MGDLSLGSPTVLLGAVGIVMVLAIFVLDMRGKNKRKGKGAAAGRGGWPQWKRRLGYKAAVKAAKRRIPPRDDRPDQDLVCWLGKAGGHGLYYQHEDAILVYGPTRSGKTRSFANRAVAEAIGPVVSTGTKNDVLRATLEVRAERGRVAVYDPLGVVPDSIGITRLKWCPVAGCEDPEVALRRANAWADAGPTGNVKNGDFFNRRAAETLGPLLHAAALTGGTIMDVYEWADNLGDRDLMAVLTERGPRGWATRLRSTANSRAGETVDSLKMTMGGLMSALASPRVVETLTPGPGEQFDVRSFLGGSNTLYLLADGRAGEQIAPVFTMMLDEILYQANIESQHHEGGFLWPPLRVVGDEIAQLAPVRNLDVYMADSGGRGIQVMPIVQTTSQLKKRWGPEAADTIRFAASATLYLPGVKDEALTRHIERLAGKRRVARTTTSSSTHGGSTSTSTEWEQVLPEADVPKLPDEHAWLEYRNLPIGDVYLPQWQRPRPPKEPRVRKWARALRDDEPEQVSTHV